MLLLSVVRWGVRGMTGLPRPFWVLWGGTLLNRLGYFVAPFLTLYLVGERGLSPMTAGVAVTAFGAGSLAGQPIGGWLADRLGRRPALVSSMAATAAAYLALGAARGLPAIAACAFLAGLATDAYRPAVSAAVADVVAPSEQRRAYGLLYWAINLGVGVSTVVGGALAERAFGLIFVLDAATCLAFAAVVLIAVPETRPAGSRAVPAAPGRGTLAVLRDRRLLGLTLSTFAAAVVYLQWIVTLPLDMRANGLDASAYGLVAAVNPLVILAGQPVLARLLRTWSSVRVYAASGIFAGLGFGLTGLVDTVAGYAATVAVWTVGEIMLNLSAPVILATIAPADMRGRYSGVWGTSWGLAMFAAPLLGTWTLQRLGPGPLWFGCAVVAVAATLVLPWERRKWTVEHSKL